jgi:hypothetical protein
MNCNYSFPSEPYSSDFAICLNDPEFEPYLDDLLDNHDFSRCRELVKQKRFPWEQEACPDFDPMDITDEDVPLSPELSSAIEQLARDGKLTAETLELTILEDNWANMPVQQYVERLNNADTPEARKKAVRDFGVLINYGNRDAFDALCSYLKDLPPPTTVEQTHFRIAIFREISHTREFDRDLAQLLVEDLSLTPSNNTTRGWYTTVFRFFERSSLDIAEKALLPILDSPQFSYRIKKRVKGILSWLTYETEAYW